MPDQRTVVHTITVLLADDHQLMRQGLRLLIESEPDMRVVEQADNGLDACALASAVRPDVVVMDVAMPGGHGIEATARIRATCPSVKVVALSRHCDPGYVRRMLTAGATGYVVKKSSASQLVQAIRTVAGGGTYLDSDVTQLLARDVDGASVRRDWTEAVLTDREVDVLRRVARGRSIKEIAAELAVSGKTVEYHKARCCAKLQLKSRADIVRYAISQRWMDE